MKISSKMFSRKRSLYIVCIITFFIWLVIPTPKESLFALDTAETTSLLTYGANEEASEFTPQHGKGARVLILAYPR